MISKLQIDNFRCIKHLEADLKRLSIFVGENDKGKSTALNALNWVITNTVFTDKYGDGENDIQSIIPTDHRKGEHTEVSIWLDTGTKYTKVLKRSYDRSTGKVNKHETEYLINDAKCSKQQDFYDSLYEQLKFTPKFTKLKVNEVRLFTDPLYALLKLDYKELRSLLVSMGCTVTNEELYRSGFEDMRQYEAKHLGKWDVMRKGLKDNSSKIDGEIKILEAQLKLFNTVEEYNDSTVKQLQYDKLDLINKKLELRNKGIDELVSDIDNEKTKLTLDLNAKRNEKRLEYNSQIKELELEQKNIVDSFNNEKAQATNEINSKINEKNKEISLKRTELYDFRLKAGRLDIDIRTLEIKNKNTSELLAKASEDLGNLMNGDNKDFICPICGCPIDIHAEEHEALMNELSANIKSYENEIAENKIELNIKLREAETVSADIDGLVEIINDLNDELKELEKQKVTIEQEFKLDKKVEEIKTRIFELNEKIRNINLEFEEETKAIDDLTEKRNCILLENQQEINDEVRKIDSEIEAKDLLIKEENQKEKDWKQKVTLETSLKEKTKEFNDNESLLARCNEFIKAMCKAINDKAKQITGFEFVLLEENITNAGISEVCYIVDDKGVPFKDINTARKTIMGIEFIESCRRIAGTNELPILADRLEGLDSNNLKKLSEITNNQIICTRVSDGEFRVEGV